MPVAQPSTHTRNRSLRAAADAAASRLPPLLAAARRIAATVALGSHGRRRAGPGESFWQFRPYSRDDTPQSIDWRQTGKFDAVYVREREWVAAQTVGLWCDTSPSMHYSSGRALPTKAERAAVLLIALAELLVEGGERILYHSDDGRPHRAATGRITVAHIADALSDALADAPRPAQTDASAPSLSLPPHATAVLIGDFLSPLADVGTLIRDLSRHGNKGCLLQVIDPAEETLPFRGRVRFVGLEDEGTAVIERTENARANYVRRLAEHRDGLRQMAARAGWTFAVHRTDQPPQMALAALHQIISGPRW